MRAWQRCAAWEKRFTFVCQPDKGAVRTGFHAEEINENALLGGGVLIDQYANGSSALEGAQNITGRVFLFNHLIA